MVMPQFMEVGPVNGALLLGMLLLTLGVCLRALRTLRAGEPMNLWPVVITLAMPLVFSVYACTMQLDAGIAAATTHPNLPARQTLMAMALSRALHTQMLAGIAASLGAALLIVGSVASTTLGARPRMGVAAAGILLTFGLTATALAGGSATGAWEIASIRALLYLAAGIGATAALLTTHERGPGAQVGPLAAASLPLLVAGIDTASSGWISVATLRGIALAAPEAKQGLLDAGASTLFTLQGFSSLQLALALGLAALGPVASLSRRRDLLPAQMGALGMALTTGAGVLIWSNTWVSPFLMGH